MQKSYLLVAAAAVTLMLQIPIALAQGTPSTDTTAAPSAATTPPATAAAPAATTAPTTTTAAPGASTESSKQPSKSTEKKPTKKKMTRQQEIDHSIESGTVPARKSVKRFSLATNAERVCAEIMLKQETKAR
jgi:hypothetical protein